MKTYQRVENLVHFHLGGDEAEWIAAPWKKMPVTMREDEEEEIIQRERERDVEEERDRQSF